MNHISQMFNAKFASKTPSPSVRLFPPNTGTPRTQNCCRSWSGKMLGKIRECRDSIKGMMAGSIPDLSKIRTPFTRRSCVQTRGEASVLFTNGQGSEAVPQSPTLPDIVSSAHDKVPNATNHTSIRRCKTYRENLQLISSAPNDSYVNNSRSYYCNSEPKPSRKMLSCSTPDREWLETRDRWYSALEAEDDRRTICFMVNPDTALSCQDPGGKSTVGKQKISAEPFLSLMGSPQLFWEADFEDSLQEERSSEYSSDRLQYYGIDNDGDVSIVPCRKVSCKEVLEAPVDYKHKLVFPTKRRISVDPLVPFAKESEEKSSWFNDTSSSKDCDFLDQSESFSTALSAPQLSSTLCDQLEADNNALPAKLNVLSKDSGFENHDPV